MKKANHESFSEGKKPAKAEARLWEIVAKIPGLVYQFKMDNKGSFSFTFISEGVKSFLGVSPNEIYANSDLGFASIHPEDLKTVINGGSFSAQSLQQRAFIFRVKDAGTGKYKWVKASSQPAKQPDGSVIWNGIMMDVTMDKETEAHSIATAQETNSELESFSYTVSHDLQTPLRSILGFSKILLAEHTKQLDAEVISYLKIIEINAKRMSALTKDLLAFSRLGKAAITYSNVDMDAQAQEVIDELVADNSNQQVKIIKHSLGSTVCDARLLKQVWLNLVGNAFKYSAKKEDAVIEIGMVEAKDETVYFVKDNGAGFDMKYADRLFAPFQRIHSLEEFEGSGIGLATVHRIITKHGGRVWAEAKPGDGACFYFSLPPVNE